MSRPRSLAGSHTSLTLRTPSLEDLLIIRPSGLDEIETWAVLCQSVQALQDLFLSDGVTAKFSLPIVTPATLKLSSKGRVNFQPTDSFIGVFGPSSHLANYLAPEYRVNKAYTDTEYERMWVFSLGQTLKRAVAPGQLVASKVDSELCQVLSEMTMETGRASLMYLLDVMSQYCKRRQQNRPFSHVVMDLHQEALAGIEATTDILDWGPPAMPKLVPRSKTLSENTDKFSTLNRRMRFLDSCSTASKITKEVSTSMEDLSFASLNNTPGKTVRPKSLCLPEMLSRPQEEGVNQFNKNFKLPIDNKPHLRVRRNPVQRIGSRLYGADLTVNKSVGPEFVIKSSLPPKHLVISNCKGHKKSVTVILLDGQKLEITCNPNTTTADQLLQLIIEEEQIEENFILGISSLIAGDFVFIPAETRLCKALPSTNTDITLYLRIRFFLPSLRGLKGTQARHFLYLQLRRSVLEHQLPSTFSQIIELNGLALQAEFGNYREGMKNYFLLEHYVPETMISIVDDESHLRQDLENAHSSRKGLDREKAEQEYIAFAQNLPHYGGHFYTAVWMLKDNKKNDVWLYISAQGVSIFERGKVASHFGLRLHETFEWKNIQTLCYSKHYLTIIPQCKINHLKKFKLKMDHKKSYFAFRLASLHHQFFLKLRREFMSLQSLSQHFGIPLKDMKNAANSFFKLDQCNDQFVTESTRVQCDQVDQTINEEQQNKENEKPLKSGMILDSSYLADLPSLGPEKRRGVKMGTRAFSKSVPRPTRSMEAITDYLENASLSSISLQCSSPSIDDYKFSVEGEAFVLDTTLKSVSQQNFFPNFQESINETFLEKLNNISFVEERVLSSVIIEKDFNGSLGLQVTEGSDGNVYIESVIEGGPADRAKGIMKGDQVIAVNGQSLLGRKYCESLQLLKGTGRKVEFVLSRLVTQKDHRTGGLSKSASLRSPSVESQVEKHTVESCFDLSNSMKYVSVSPVKPVAQHYNTLPSYSNNATKSKSDNDRAVIVEMIPKKQVFFDTNPFLTKAISECDISQTGEPKYLRKKQTVAVPRSLGLGRKWHGPVRYPVTPIKKSLDETQEVSSDDEQVFI